jgi:hypothetical protein
MLNYEEVLRKLREPCTDLSKEDVADALEELIRLNEYLVKSLDASRADIEKYREQILAAEERYQNLIMKMDCAGPIEKLYAENDVLHNRVSAMDDELRIARGQLDMVRLIFGGR